MSFGHPPSRCCKESVSVFTTEVLTVLEEYLLGDVAPKDIKAFLPFGDAYDCIQFDCAWILLDEPFQLKQQS